MIGRPRLEFRGVLRAAMAEVDPDRAWPDGAIRDLSLAIQAGLREGGLAIHDESRCVRPGGPPVGEIGRTWDEVMGQVESTS